MNASLSVLRTVTIGSLALALVACASSGPRPTEDIARAETSIRQAEQAGAAEHSPRELDLARQKLEDARLAVTEYDNAVAERLAEQASADAELAAALSRTAQAEAAAQQIEETIATLRQESGLQ